jgi:hypothetical protein
MSETRVEALERRLSEVEARLGTVELMILRSRLKKKRKSPTSPRIERRPR